MIEDPGRMDNETQKLFITIEKVKVDDFRLFSNSNSCGTYGTESMIAEQSIFVHNDAKFKL